MQRQGMYHGKLARLLNVSWVEIEGDNKEMIKASVSEFVPPWESNSIVQDIHQLKMNLTIMSVCCSSRTLSHSSNRKIHNNDQLLSSFLSQFFCFVSSSVCRILGFVVDSERF